MKFSPVCETNQLLCSGIFLITFQQCKHFQRINNFRANDESSINDEFDRRLSALDWMTEVKTPNGPPGF